MVGGWGRRDGVGMCMHVGKGGHRQRIQLPSSYLITKLFCHPCTGPAPAILDWYGHCVRVSVNKLGG